LTGWTGAAYPCGMAAHRENSQVYTLCDDEVHVWYAELGGSAAELEACRVVLNADERARADRLAHAEHRDRFAIARGVLRRLLGHYLHVDPGALVFGYAQHGKPFLRDGSLHFNMSHSHNLALYAVTLEREVGIDIEWPRAKVAHEEIAARFFSLEEQEALAGLPAAQHREAFYNIWTRKEAYVKARGDGIAAGLDTFSVSLGGEAALLNSDQGRTEIERWKLVALEPAPGYVAALCAEGDWRFSCFNWER